MERQITLEGYGGLIEATLQLYSYTIYNCYSYDISSAHVAGYETLLAQMSCENGLFESVGSIALSIASLYALYSLLKYRFTDMDRAILVILSILFFLASMEEISWGQHIFHFPSSRYFLENNLQEETNLHNLIDGNIFSSIIYSTIYIFLIYNTDNLKVIP